MTIRQLTNPMTVPIRRGMSLIEVLMAVFILGIGAIAIATLFPAGIAQQRRSVDDVIGPIVANNAIDVIRTKIPANHFGTFEQFNTFAPIRTVSGDWPWIRPSLIKADVGSTPDVNERGAIAIFPRRGDGDAPNYQMVHDIAISTIGGYSAGGGAFIADGLPWNRGLFNDFVNSGVPNHIITQAERTYPAGRPATSAGEPTTPQYYWECAFRRFQGRIQVAIFVYRVALPAGERLTYTTPYDAGNNDIAMPMHLDLVDHGLNWQQPVAPYNQPWFVNDLYVRGTSGTPDNLDFDGQPKGAVDEADLTLSWQSPGQWILDQNNSLHRVLSGRRQFDEDGVELSRHVPAMPNANAYLIGRDGFGNPTGEVVTDIWYLPRRIRVDGPDVGTDIDNNDPLVTITPVYATVKEL